MDFPSLLCARLRRSSVARSLLAAALAGVCIQISDARAANEFALNAEGFFHRDNVDVLVFNNFYDGAFSDAKISSIELIQQDVRSATNGDVRLGATPGQWDPVPQLVSRKVDTAAQTVMTELAYPAENFRFKIEVAGQAEGVRIRVLLDEPLPEKLVGKAGLHLEFLPSAYFHRSYLADGQGGIFPLHPSSDMTKLADGSSAPKALAQGHDFVFAPEDDARRVSLRSTGGAIELFDGRDTAQNGWFVVRTLLEPAKTGVVAEWFLNVSADPAWRRAPVIGHSQVGYAPVQTKVAVIELDKRDLLLGRARVLRINRDGTSTETLAAAPQPWGAYLRYNYATFDFSAVREPGLYVLEYGATRTKPFRISADVYAAAWHPTLDVYLPVAMDHMSVKEAYRVWHGHSHRDDALQAPVNHEHFDLYAQGPTTDSKYQPFEHIPGLNVGGWLDAGDFDVRTQTQYAVVRRLVQTWETFKPMRDETTVDQAMHHVEIHRPDGIPDILQQIEHGTLQLIAQHRSVGHAICGIIEPDLGQYTHLGDAASKTDNLIYNPKLKPGESDGLTSGVKDDRWAMTTHTTPLNYGSAGALAAASRALRGYRDELADECLATAKKVWEDEHSHPPAIFQHGNTTGGPLEIEEFGAAVELLIATKDPRYAKRIDELWPAIEPRFGFVAATAVDAIPYMNAAYREKVRAAAAANAKRLADLAKDNPYGVPIWKGGWAGNGLIIEFAVANYALHRAFPDLIDTSGVYRGLNYIYGTHPASDISFVSAVGTVSKEIAYGSNRADFSFIAGGIVPGLLILKPDFPENKEDWPFLWGENEYVVNVGPSYIYLVHAVNQLLAEK
ncbi:MAG TPA: glycoside hydrolase family 9 protein [Opitutaceae bacterium]|nr:glycoside hydrolase family 9 protein [Opitutaceae bacterium]